MQKVRIMQWVGCLSLLFLGGCSATTEKPATDSQIAHHDAAPLAADKDEVICTSRKATGSNFKKTRCVTKAVYEQEADDAKEELRKFNNVTLNH